MQGLQVGLSVQKFPALVGLGIVAGDVPGDCADSWLRCLLLYKHDPCLSEAGILCCLALPVHWTTTWTEQSSVRLPLCSAVQPASKMQGAFTGASVLFIGTDRHHAAATVWIPGQRAPAGCRAGQQPSAGLCDPCTRVCIPVAGSSRPGWMGIRTGRVGRRCVQLGSELVSDPKSCAPVHAMSSRFDQWSLWQSRRGTKSSPTLSATAPACAPASAAPRSWPRQAAMRMALTRPPWTRWPLA